LNGVLDAAMPWVLKHAPPTDDYQMLPRLRTIFAISYIDLTQFYRMGFSDQEIVALSGAHALGRCHTDRSGFEGPWTFSPTTFSNDYYKLLLSERWVSRSWKGPSQLQDKKTKSLMMLPSDMALVQDREFKKHVERYAKDSKAFFEDFAKAFKKLEEVLTTDAAWRSIQGRYSYTDIQAPRAIVPRVIVFSNKIIIASSMAF
jgi:Peroxidase